MTMTWRGSPEVQLDAHSASPELARTVEHVLIPRLLLAHCPPSMPASDLPPRPIEGAELDAFLAELRSPDDGACLERTRALLRSGVSAESVMLDLLAPAARTMGTLWEDDACDFVAVTVALGRLQRSLHEISASRGLRGTGASRALAGTVLLSCVPGEQHLLGLLMAAEFFARDEWEVLLGPPVSTRLPLDEVQRHEIDVVGFSVGSARRLEELTQTIAELRRVSRNPKLRVIVGGPCFVESPDAWRQVGADAVSVDARTAPALARQVIAPIAPDSVS